jgi:hypothetical protein
MSSEEIKMCLHRVPPRKTAWDLADCSNDGSKRTDGFWLVTKHDSGPERAHPCTWKKSGERSRGYARASDDDGADKGKQRREMRAIGTCANYLMNSGASP